MTTTRTDTTVARNLLAQLTKATAWKCGLRDFVALDDGLQCKVGGLRRGYLVLTLNVRDLYDVEVVRMTASYERRTVLSLSDVHAEDLNRVLCDAEGHGWKAVA